MKFSEMSYDEQVAEAKRLLAEDRHDWEREQFAQAGEPYLTPFYDAYEKSRRALVEKYAPEDKADA